MNTWKLDVIVAMLLLPAFSVAALAQTQAGMNREACGEYTKADAELNTIYQQVLRDYKADALFIGKLTAAQRTWIPYRDAHLAALYPAADPRSQYGSVYPACRCAALAEVTRKRTEELRRWTGGAAEGDVCAGSVRARADAGPSSPAVETEGSAWLFGTRWSLTEMGERSFGTGEPYLEFDREQGRFSGSSGCNRIFGSFRVDGADLKFTPVASTRRACLAAEAQQVEASFLKALETTTRFRIQGDVLRLYANDSPILIFRAGARDAGGATAKASVTARETAAISISEIAKGQQCGITTQRFEVIRDSSSFTNLWRSHSEGFSPAPEQPVVDFDQNMVIATFFGEQRTGGYSIEITGVAELADSIVVNVKGTLPGAGCMLTMAVSKPYHVVNIPKSSKPAAFVTTVERANCP
jgi:heat shock protein HslJ/uncharacterized protein YecT (DUF1311 family)